MYCRPIKGINPLVPFLLTVSFQATKLSVFKANHLVSSKATGLILLGSNTHCKTPDIGKYSITNHVKFFDYLSSSSLYCYINRSLLFTPQN